MSDTAAPATLATSPPGPVEQRVAFALILLSAGLGIIAISFVRVHLPEIPAFIPIYESALFICDLITAIMLVGQFIRLRALALLILASGYLFDALMIIPHALTFPGAFAPTGLLGAGTQTTAWLYCFWHGGFPLFVIGYALCAGRPSRPLVAQPGAAVGLAVIGVGLLATALTLLATAGSSLLPVIIANGNYERLVSLGVSPAIWLLTVTATVLMWRRRHISVLDLWVLAVLCAWLCDIGLSAVVGSNRFDLGWYTGRAYGLLAATFVLGVVLIDLNRLYGSLAGALALAETRNAELSKSREALAHAQRLDAMGQLTGGVAHDFNNLLTVIVGNLSLIISGAQDADKVTRLATAARRACERGERLTQQLLTFGRRQIIRPETVNLNRTITDIDSLLRRAASEEMEIVTRLSPVLDPVRLDPAQFETALLNLVVNARDASGRKGKITVETANLTLDADYARRFEEVNPGHYVMVAVSDTGTGMTQETIAQAFDPFFTTKDVGKGSGLGLSQVYGFVKTAGGHSHIYSEVGVGTTVKLYFPRTADNAVAVDVPHTVAPPRPKMATESVLVVEDDPDVLEIAVEGLSALGYRVSTATDARYALDIIRSDQRIDILFSDVVMPGGMNGVQLAVEARRIRPSLKVLLTSGYTASALAIEHGIPPGLEVIGKPYKDDDLANKLRLVINS